MNTINPENSSTRQRLLAAATRVFTRDGLEGTTMWKIAREAGVNEVTLFRHFQTKAKLQDAVVERVIDLQVGLFAAQPTAFPCDLRSSLLHYIHIYEALLDLKHLLLGTLFSEIHRSEEYQRRVLTCIFPPLRTGLVAILKAARDAEIVCADVEPTIAADILNAMIFTAAIRQNSPCPRWKYSRADYVKNCVDVFVRGIEQKRC